MSLDGKAQLDPAQYAELVRRIRVALAEALPAGARALIVSRGDDALLELPGVSTAHFPQDASGAYAGHHPRDSAEAVAHLEQLRQSGAEYLAIPDTARWWLDYYGGLAEHLSSRAELLADLPGVCIIFRLSLRTAEASGAVDATLSDASIAQMRDYLEHLVSTDARIAVLEPVQRPLAGSLGPLHATGVPVEGDSGAGDALLGELERLAETGVDYLVVPREADEWLAARRDVEVYVEKRCRKVADQRYLCRVFELAGARAA